ncbi:glycogen/starch/alpha-glucan phosphorylase [Paenibacillus sp. WLX1005]|uniref:glycogen/starch/alpha-glucan phosphorylase n=1 Tax=Paenibacillus sp. WLX1005 TaxID=3243766 RepID=UPI003983E78D
MFTTKEEFKQIFQDNVVSKLGKPLEEVSHEDVYTILSRMMREFAGREWAATNRELRQDQEKQVYYLSLEFLIGRLLGNNLLNMGMFHIVQDGLAELGISLDDIEEQEADAGLGNGGLGRLAACFLDSLASLGYAGHGCGIRYRYGLFEQKIVDENQVELPDDWLQKGFEWEVRRADRRVEVRFGGQVETREEEGQLRFSLRDYEAVWAIPYDVPVIGYRGGKDDYHINTLRLWSAEPVREMANRNLGGSSNYYSYLNYNRSVESISEFLYPDDSHYEGRLLRLKQQYFLCSAGLQSILRTYDKLNVSYDQLPDKIAIHINDTHPTLVIPELMRILMDEKGYSWDRAWDITTRTVSYTNHTILSEALEKWPAQMIRDLTPRVYMIIDEINARFCRLLMDKYPDDPDRVAHMAIVYDDQVKMAHLAIAGSYSINGVAALHTDILKEREMRNFYELYPQRFNNKTNGITHRRWLMHANPQLSDLISESIGKRWITHPQELTNLIKFSEDASFQQQVAGIKQHNKQRLAQYIEQKYGTVVNTESIFDVQIKRLHAYKRQLLNILHVMYLYNQIKSMPSQSTVPRTFIFGAKAAPGYYLAKSTIKLINRVANVVNNDPDVKDKLNVFFLENYSVSLAEKIIPAADISEQISTASKEASGTGNMKLMMNGALTIGTMDGANVEMFEMLGNANMFIFGLSADEVMNYYQHGGYVARDVYNSDPRIREVVDQLVVPGAFAYNSYEFESLYRSLLDGNDEYFMLKDFDSYAESHVQIEAAYRNQKEWLKKSIHNIAHSGKFSSDRTISQYAAEIWKIKPIH